MDPDRLTGEAYAQVLGSPRYIRTFVNSYAIALAVTVLSLAGRGCWRPTRSPASASAASAP